MNIAFTNAVYFYRDTIAQTVFNCETREKRVFPVKREEFAFGAILTSVYLIKGIALSAFYGMGVLFTGGQK